MFDRILNVDDRLFWAEPSALHAYTLHALQLHTRLISAKKAYPVQLSGGDLTMSVFIKGDSFVPCD